MSFAEFGTKLIRSGKNAFLRETYDVSQEDKVLTDKINKYNNVDVYRSIFTYESNDLSNSKIIGPLYFDFDLVPESNDKLLLSEVRAAIVNLQKIFKLAVSDIKIYFSGHKGFHVIIPEETFGLTFCDYGILTRTYHAIAQILVDCWHEFRPDIASCLDLKIYDHRRMFRLANSVNSKSGLYKVEIPASYLKQYTFSDIRQFATMPKTSLIVTPRYSSTANKILVSAMRIVESDKEDNTRVTRERTKSNKMLPCVENILSTSVNEGRRNNVAVALASALFQLQISSDEVISIMQEWNDNNDPPLNDDELFKVIMSAKRMDDKDMHYGCTGIKDIGFCDNSCNVRKYKG